MDQLPLEVLEHIVSYLSDEDLSRCCTVCKSWREVFTNGIFWKKHCNTNLSVYLEKTKSLVEPCFVTPVVEGSGLTVATGWQLCFLREQHYLKNWRLGRYKQEEIEFDCDDTISYNVKVECVADEFVFLHTTYETQAWNVAQEPNLILTIPFGLVELWERNLYKVFENKLIVVQCNVVQIFNLCLASKTWSFDRTFFFDKPEEFSSNINEKTDVNELFKKTSHEIGETLEKVICGNFLIGIIRTKAALQDPVLHVWDLKTIRKIKEQKCSNVFGLEISQIFLETSESSNDKIIVICQKHKQKFFAVYDLDKLQFLGLYECFSGEAIILKNYLYMYDFLKLEIVMYNLDTNSKEVLHKFEKGRLVSWHNIFGKMIVAGTIEKCMLLNPLSKLVETEFNSSFPLGSFVIVKDRFIALHDRSGCLRELLELRTLNQLTKTKQTCFTSLFSLPHDKGTCRAFNDVGTKIVMERANKLIILNFW